MLNPYKAERISQHSKWKEGLSSRNTDLMATCILSGHIGSIGTFPIDLYAQIVYEALKTHPTLLSTRVCYAFLLSCQQEDALSVISQLIPLHPTHTSKLYTFKGWIESSVGLDAISSFENAVKLDNCNTQARFLLVQARLAHAGNVEYSCQTIQIATEYLESYSTDLLSNYSVDPSFLLMVSMKFEASFRRGPRAGVSLDRLIKDMNCLVQVFDHARKQLDLQWTGVTFHETEIKTMEDSRSRMMSMLDLVKSRH